MKILATITYQKAYIKKVAQRTSRHNEKRPSDWRFAWPLRRRTDEKTIGLAISCNAIGLPKNQFSPLKRMFFLYHYYQWLESWDSVKE
jgi:hypothetical protein